MDNDQPMPQIGFGTFGRRGGEGQQAIERALATGYRHIDTAQSYNTEAECGAALKASGLGREAVFVTTKIEMGNLKGGLLESSLEKSCARLGLGQVDLTLVHWPVTPSEVLPMDIYLEEIAQAQANGLTRMIGVSNFTIAHLEQAKSILGAGRIDNHQFELHPYLQNNKLADYCRANSISITCYAPLGQGVVVNDPVLAAIGENHRAAASQIALAFLVGKGYAVIPTSGKPERIDSNFAAAEIKLSPDEIARIEGLDRGHRVIAPVWAPDWD